MSAATAPVRVLVVDDHPIVRAGIAAALAGADGFAVVGEAGDGRQAVARADELAPDLVLMDLRMPHMGGVEATRLLRERHPGAIVVVLTMYETDQDILGAIEAGATGYLLKDMPRRELLAGIRAAVEGQVALSPSVARILAARQGRPRAQELSPREVEVLRLVARGLSNQQIAARLVVSEATVKTHLQRIFAKLGVTDRTRAATLALERHLLG